MVITTATAAEELPVLIIDNNIIEYEILPRLPAKSICRFKAVSKRWNSFLSTRMFVNMQLLQHHINNPIKTYKLLLLDKPPADKDFCREPLNDGSVTVGFNILEKADPRFDFLLASLDGLVCVASKTKTFLSSNLALWNPLTDAYYKLSSPNDTRPYDSKTDAIGFYSDSSNDYKILHLVAYSGAYIYSQRLNSWRKIRFFIENNQDYHYLHEYSLWSRATFCDHSLYFSVIEPHTHKGCIICFDVNKEVFRVIQFPPIPSDATRYRRANLVVVNGCIYLCALYCGGTSFNDATTWKLNGDDGTWAKVALSPHAPYRVFARLRQHNICMTRNARDSWLAILEDNNSSKFKMMNKKEFAIVNQSSFTYRRIIYHETLVSPIPPSAVS